MATVRVTWDGKGIAKRSGGVGPQPMQQTTLLTKAGVDLSPGRYQLQWLFVGETGDTISLAVEQKSSKDWKQLCQTGPHKVPNSTDRVDSRDKKPPGYIDIFFVVT